MTLRRTLSAAALVVVAWTSSHADVPMLLNYQGHLTDASGNPETGSFTMDFAVFDAESGGNQLPSPPGIPWSETQSVQVTDGIFNVLLGSVTALPADLFMGGPSDSAGPLRYLQVTVSGETLDPRRRISSVAYAISAEVDPRSLERPTFSALVAGAYCLVVVSEVTPDRPVIAISRERATDAGQTCVSACEDGAGGGFESAVSGLEEFTRFEYDADGQLFIVGASPHRTSEPRSSAPSIDWCCCVIP